MCSVRLLESPNGFCDLSLVTQYLFWFHLCKLIVFCFLFSRRNRVTACPLLCVYKYTDRVDAYTRFRPAQLLGYWLGTSLRLHLSYSNFDILQRSAKRPNCPTSGVFGWWSRAIWPICYSEVGNLRYGRVSFRVSNDCCFARISLG